MNEIEKRLAALPPEKRKLFLRQLNRESSTQKSDLQQISPHSRETNTFPLSYSQKRVWFLDQLEPGNVAFNIPLAIRLRGNLHIQALEKGVSEIVKRHESLRTTFKSVDGKPLQIIHHAEQIALPVMELESIPETRREAEVDRLISEEFQKPFDLTRGPLLRTKLLRLSAIENIFLITMHHIVSDAWSMNLFVRELEILYRAFCSEQPSPLEDLSIQYVDYMNWQSQRVESGGVESQLVYWKKKLAQPLPVLEFPTDYARPATQTFRGETISRTVTAELTRALKDLTRQENATLFMSMLTAFQVLLHRYTGQTDIVVGTPIAGRDYGQAENLIGFFLNTLVLRTDLSGQPSFREALSRVRQTALDAYANQDIPFEKLLEELHPQRDPSRTSLFQVFFNMLNVGEDEINLLNLKSEVVFRLDTLAKFDLTLYLGEQSGTIELILVYNCDLFNRAHMAELLQQYHQILEAAVSEPNVCIQNISLVTPQASQKLPDPRSPLDSRWYGSIPSRFSQKAREFPNRLALVDESGRWTYEELDKRSNQLAHYLRQQGIKHQDIVAIYAARQASLVWALLGVLKAGAAFMILDPAYPSSRLAEYISLAEPRCFINLTANCDPPEAIEASLHSLGGQLVAHLQWNDTSIDRWNDFSDDYPNVETNPDDLTYIAFTSGSTGHPKGIVGTHKPLSHFIHWHTNTFHFNETDRFSMLSGLSHDPLLRDIFTPLWLGATLYIPDQEILLRPGQLLTWLKQHSISVVHITPSIEQLLTDTTLRNGQVALNDLSYAFFGGEILTRQHIIKLKHLAPTVTCVNFYGATETPQAMAFSVIDLSADIHAIDSVRPKETIPVGRGIEDVQLLVMNTNKELAGMGELGELHIRTPYLSQGYLKDARLTQEKFITNPYTGDPFDRIYQTGDLGRFLPDGSVEYLGRRDRQVKLRGFRIELGEIEASINEHPDVKQNAISAVGTDGGEKHLIAYIVLKPASISQSIDLREFLQKRLPSYMIPSRFIFLDTLPVTPNGKIDYHALPSPNDLENQVHENSRVAARNQTEAKLVGIWEELLHVQSIGVGDDFFDLGGHSLLAVHMFSRIDQEFGVNLPIATLFREATIEYLAQVIHDKSGPSTWSSLIEIEPEGNHLPFFCVHGITGDIMWFRELARCLAPDYPFYGLQSRGLDGIQDPLTRIEEMASHYIGEIRMLQPTGPYFLGGASFGGTVALEIAQQLLAQGEQVSTLAIFDHSPPNVDVDANTGKLRRRLIIGYRILRNFPRWLKEFVQMGSSGMLLRFRRKLRLIRKVKGQSDSNKFEQVDAEDLIDFASELSVHRQLVITRNYQALKPYAPQPYAGRVTLFRASNRPLLNTYDPEASWQILAPGRVDVSDIPSSHEGMFRQPHVQYLAQLLKASIEQAANQGNNFEPQ